MTKILITGANSFVGINFKKYSRYEHVDEFSLIENEPENINFDPYDVVLHLVAIVHQTKSIPEEEYFKINTELCLRTAKAAKKEGVKQFVFMSTVKVYGPFNPKQGVWNEFSKCNPDDSYGKSKYAAELALKELEDENFTISVIRTPLVYGEDVRANMLSLIRLVEKFPTLPLGSIENRRSFTAVQNLVAFIDQIIEKNASGVFIAKDQEDLSTTQLVQFISKFLNKRVRLLSIPRFISRMSKKIYPRVFDRLYGSFYLENMETLRKLDFKPPLTIEEGLQKMIESYLSKKNKN